MAFVPMAFVPMQATTLCTHAEELCTRVGLSPARHSMARVARRQGLSLLALCFTEGHRASARRISTPTSVTLYV